MTTETTYRDPEDCDDCYALEDVCAYHQGVADGVRWMADKLALIAADPEWLEQIKVQTP